MKLWKTANEAVAELAMCSWAHTRRKAEGMVMMLCVL